MYGLILMTIITMFPIKVLATEYQNQGTITFTEELTVDSTGNGNAEVETHGEGSLPDLSEFVHHNYGVICIVLIVFLWVYVKRKERN